MLQEPTKRTQRDEGFSLIELLIVIVILGILATIVVFAVRGVTDDASSAACDADARTLANSIEGYFALAPAVDVPGTDAKDDREQALIGLGLLRHPSQLYDVDANGALVLDVDSPCTL